MPYPKVTVVGAGHVGATATFALLSGNLADVVLVDVAEGLPQGKALDMMHSRSVLRFGPTVTGTNEYGATAGSDVVVITAGVARKPGMSRDDLLATNGSIVRSVVESAVAASPDAVVLCVTNPLDVMTQLAWRASGLPSARVLGMGGVLDSARFAFVVAEATGASVDDVETLVIGAHGDGMVPLPRLTTVAGRPLTDMLQQREIDGLVYRTVHGGAEVVALLKSGSAFYAPAASVVSMVRAILDDSRAIMPSSVLLEGEYGLRDVYVSVPAVLGREGVVGLPELDLTEQELGDLRASAATVTEGVGIAEAAGGAG